MEKWKFETKKYKNIGSHVEPIMNMLRHDMA
jgi:hypothetical protein